MLRKLISSILALAMLIGFTMPVALAEDIPNAETVEQTLGEPVSPTDEPVPSEAVALTETTEASAPTEAADAVTSADEVVNTEAPAPTEAADAVTSADEVANTEAPAPTEAADAAVEPAATDEPAPSIEPDDTEADESLEAVDQAAQAQIVWKVLYSDIVVPANSSYCIAAFLGVDENGEMQWPDDLLLTYMPETLDYFYVDQGIYFDGDETYYYGIYIDGLASTKGKSYEVNVTATYGDVSERHTINVTIGDPLPEATDKNLGDVHIGPGDTVTLDLDEVLPDTNVQWRFPGSDNFPTVRGLDFSYDPSNRTLDIISWPEPIVDGTITLYFYNPITGEDDIVFKVNIIYDAPEIKFTDINQPESSYDDPIDIRVGETQTFRLYATNAAGETGPIMDPILNVYRQEDAENEFATFVDVGELMVGDYLSAIIVEVKNDAGEVYAHDVTVTCNAVEEDDGISYVTILAYPQYGVELEGVDIYYNTIGEVTPTQQPTAAPTELPSAQPSPTATTEPRPTATTVPTPTAAPTEPAQTRTGVVVNVPSSLNIRPAASMDSQPITTVKNGTVLTILGEEGNFYRVQLADGTIGYASKDYVRETTYEPAPTEPAPTEPAPTEPVPARKGVVVNVRTSLNIRPSADTTGRPLTTVKNGTELTILGEEGDFYRVQLADGTIGYASMDYVSERASIDPDEYDYFVQVATNGGRLNLRRTPGGARIAQIPNGTRLVIVEVVGEWSLVEYDGLRGYVSNDYIKPVIFDAG